MKKIKNLMLLIFASVMIISISSCEEIGLSILEKPSSTDVTIDTIFSNAEYAERVLWNAYSSLRSGLLQGFRANDREVGGDRAIGQDVLADITDISHTYKTWSAIKTYYYNESLNSSNTATNEWPGNHSFFPYIDIPIYGITPFSAIRNCHILIDNIHKVPDMSDDYKERLKAEAKVLIAYNHMDMFRNLGGMPWLDRVYNPDDVFTNNHPRLTVEASVDSMVNLIDQAVPYLPWALTEQDHSNMSGRFTQAGAMALKARILLFAASPLFNSAEPYLAGEAADKGYTWYGGYDVSRYQRAADAAKELIDKIESSGDYYLEEAQGVDAQAYRDAYRKAYMSRLSTETLISVRDGYETSNIWQGGLIVTVLEYGTGVGTNEYMRMFPMADGTPITDPTSGWDENVDPLGSEGEGDGRAFSRDPRLYETLQCIDDDWGGGKVENWRNEPYSTNNNRLANNSGSTVMRKFVPTFELGAYPFEAIQFPLIRIPEIYLSYAECMNVLDDQTEAFKYINIVRNRVGLKNIEDVKATWSEEELFEQILTERACEFGFEQIRWFDITRNKLASKLEMQLSDVWIEKNHGSTGYTYSYPEISYNKRNWWTSFNPKWFLLPYPLDEVQKGYGLVQNPGW
jgi:starch-binding outer membrane protein, SusD/RagB family